MRIKKNGKVINLTEREIKKLSKIILKEQPNTWGKGRNNPKTGEPYNTYGEGVDDFLKFLGIELNPHKIKSSSTWSDYLDIFHPDNIKLIYIGEMIQEMEELFRTEGVEFDELTQDEENQLYKIVLQKIVKEGTDAADQAIREYLKTKWNIREEKYGV